MVLLGQVRLVELLDTAIGFCYLDEPVHLLSPDALLQS